MKDGHLGEELISPSLDCKIYYLSAHRFAEEVTAKWLCLFEGSGIPYGPINSMKDVFSEAQVCTFEFSGCFKKLFIDLYKETITTNLKLKSHDTIFYYSIKIVDLKKKNHNLEPAKCLHSYLSLLDPAYLSYLKFPKSRVFIFLEKKNRNIERGLKNPHL